MPTKQLCISADSHVVESAEFFEPLVKRFGDQAPRVVVADPDRGPQLALGDGQLGLGISGFFMGVSHLLHMTFLPRLCGLLGHPCFVNPAMESPPAF